MLHDLPDEVREGLEAARRRDWRKGRRLRVQIGEDRFLPILRLWEDGFALDAETAPHIRGLVDIWEGGRHLYQCLVICSSIEGRERIYAFKRQTAVVETPPAADYAPDPAAPVALLT